MSTKRAFDISHSIKNEMRREGMISHEMEEYFQNMGYILIKDKRSILENRDIHTKWTEK